MLAQSNPIKRQTLYYKLLFFLRFYLLMSLVVKKPWLQIKNVTEMSQRRKDVTHQIFFTTNCCTSLSYLCEQILRLFFVSG